MGVASCNKHGASPRQPDFDGKTIRGSHPCEGRDPSNLKGFQHIHVAFFVRLPTGVGAEEDHLDEPVSVDSLYFNPGFTKRSPDRRAYR